MGRRSAGVVLLGEYLDSGSYLCYRSLESNIWLWLGVGLYDILDLFMLWRFCPFVGIWRFYMMMYIDLMTCIFWRCMTYIRCDYWWIVYMHVVWILMWRRSVYFLNICIIRGYYRFNRNRVLHVGIRVVVSLVRTSIRWILYWYANGHGLPSVLVLLCCCSYLLVGFL